METITLKEIKYLAFEILSSLVLTSYVHFSTSMDVRDLFLPKVTTLLKASELEFVQNKRKKENSTGNLLARVKIS